MARMLKFPRTAEATERFAKIEAEKESAKLDAEIAEIRAKVDRNIEREYGSLYNYGIYTMQRVFSRKDWTAMIGIYDA